MSKNYPRHFLMMLSILNLFYVSLVSRAKRAMPPPGRNTDMSGATPVGVTVSADIPAPPKVVFDLITDITRMGEWSPETVKAVWIGDATRAAEGARFKGTNRIGSMKWSTKPTITSVVAGRLFEFKVPGKSGATWRYELSPTDRGTHVTESVRQARPSPRPIRFMQKRAGVTNRNAHLRDAMHITLQRLGVAATNVARTPLSTH
jgi:Polyketide cyclase / dehydrase and lipid transport